MDRKLAKIIADALKQPKPQCPECKAEGTMKGCSIVAWCECPKCGKKIGEAVIY